MKAKPLHLIYGIKLVAAWMLIPFVLFFFPLLVNEFKYTMTTQEVTLKEEVYSAYPDEYKDFKADVNGRERYVQAPVTAGEGDVITVILRNGDYYMSTLNPNAIRDYVTVPGRFVRIVNSNFGIHLLAIAAVLLVSFLLTFPKRKQIRSQHPALSKVTDIAGMICSGVMSAALVFGVIEGSLTGIGIAYMGLFLGIAYTAVFLIAWIVQFLIMTFAK